jgi:exopolysaccharide production protein ExoZ
VIKNIQALRAVAALMVVFVHLSDFLRTLKVPSFGAGGVDLFFVISGFVMVHTTRVRTPTWSQFVRNRIARIVPIYWLLTLVVFAIAVFAHSWVKATSGDEVQLAKSLLFIPFRKSDGLVQPVLFVGWTLNYEMFFYALFAFGLAWRNYLLGLAWVFGILSVLVLVGLIWNPNAVIPAFYTNSRMLEFALGMAIGILTDRAPKSVHAPVKWIFLLTALCLPGIVIAPLIWPGAALTVTAGIPSAILVAGAVLLERWGWSIKSVVVMMVGDASYVLYLSHPYVTVPIQKFAKHLLHPTRLSSLVLIGLSLAAVTTVALVLHKIVERPLSKAARTLLSTTPLKSQPA